MKKYVVEFIGTFFLVLTVGSVVVPPGAGALAPLPVGLVLMAMIFAGAPISGGHFNPAVTIAVWIRGKCPSVDVLPYWCAQLLAAVAAAWVVHFFKPPGSATTFAIGPKAALLAEFLFTFAVAWVVLNTQTARATGGNSFYGLAVGMTVAAGGFVAGGISISAFNPAVALGVTLMGMLAWKNIWVFLVANFAGGIVAAYTFKLLADDE